MASCCWRLARRVGRRAFPTLLFLLILFPTWRAAMRESLAAALDPFPVALL